MIVLSQPAIARRNGRIAADCALGPDRQLHIAIEGPPDLLDGVQPDLTAFLPIAMPIKDVACHGPPRCDLSSEPKHQLRAVRLGIFRGSCSTRGTSSLAVLESDAPLDREAAALLAL